MVNLKFNLKFKPSLFHHHKHHRWWFFKINNINSPFGYGLFLPSDAIVIWIFFSCNVVIVAVHWGIPLYSQNGSLSLHCESAFEVTFMALRGRNGKLLSVPWVSFVSIISAGLIIIVIQWWQVNYKESWARDGGSKFNREKINGDAPKLQFHRKMKIYLWMATTPRYSFHWPINAGRN